MQLVRFENKTEWTNVDNIQPFLRPRVVSARVFGNLPPNFFSGCFNLIDVQQDPNLIIVETIGERAFADCFSLTSVVLPSTIQIGETAFLNCNRLTSIDLPSATTIGEKAFLNCTSLTSVNLPSATTIGDSAFANCALTLVNIPLADFDYWALHGCNPKTVTVICFDTALIDELDNEIMSEENRKWSIELSKICKLIYDLTDKAVGWLKIRTRMRVAFGNVMTVEPGKPNPVEYATELQFANFTFYTFDQLRENVKKLPKPVQQIWKQYVNDKIKMYHVDITFLNQFEPGKGKGVNAFLNEPRGLRF